MARVFDKWQFSHPSTSDLDQGRGRNLNLTALAERQPIRLRATASGVPSGLPEREMSAVGTKQARSGRQSMPALPLYSDVDLLGHGKGVIDLDPEITHSALNLRMA